MVKPISEQEARDGWHYVCVCGVCGEEDSVIQRIEGHMGLDVDPVTGKFDTSWEDLEVMRELCTECGAEGSNIAQAKRVRSGH